MHDSGLLRDLRVRHRLVMGSALELVAAGGDLEAVSGLENLEQAIWLRLATYQGDLAHLGHPDYGSRLYRLIGRRPTPDTIALARAYIHEALRREERLARIHRVEVFPDPLRRDSLLIELSVQPVGEAAPLRATLRHDLSPGAGAEAEANAREA